MKTSEFNQGGPELIMGEVHSVKVFYFGGLLCVFKEKHQRYLCKHVGGGGSSGNVMAIWSVHVHQELLIV